MNYCLKFLQLAVALKDLPIRLQSASRNERKATFAALTNVTSLAGASRPKLFSACSNKTIPYTLILILTTGFEGVLKKLCKLMPNVLLRYEDRKSQCFVKDFLVKLVEVHEEATVKNLPSVLADFAGNLNTISSSYVL